MRSRTLSALLAAVLAGPLLAGSRAMPDWRQCQELVVESAGPVTVALPVATLDAARTDLGDLRIAGPSGDEVPFAVWQSRPAGTVSREPESLTTRVEDAAMVFTLETGIDDLIVALQFDAGGQRFLSRARVEESSDGIVWRLLARDLPVYDRGPRLRALQLDLPPGIYPYLRVSLGRLEGIHVALNDIVLVTRRALDEATEPVPVHIEAREEVPGETRLALNLPAANLFLASLEISTPEPVFARPVILLRRVFADGIIREVELARRSLARTAAAGRSATGSLKLDLDTMVAGRELTLVVENGDSPPLALSAVSARRRPVFAVFYAPAPGRYTLFAGNPAIHAPHYDVGALLNEVERRELPASTPGPLVPNPDFHPGEPLPAIPALGAPLDVSAWAFRRPVNLRDPGVQQLELDPAVLAHARRDLADLRLMSDGRQVPFVIDHTGGSRGIPVKGQAAPDPKQPRLSRWRFALPYPHLPLTRLTATISTPLFHRTITAFEYVEDERGDRSRHWLGQATWDQTPDRRSSEFSLPLSPPLETDGLWLETDNGDNPPIILGDARVWYGVTRLLFKAGREAPVYLVYGEPSAAMPRYDLSLVGAQLLAAEKATPTLGAEEILKPGTLADVIAGHGGVLFWTALILVVVLLLLIIARLLPKTASDESQSRPG